MQNDEVHTRMYDVTILYVTRLCTFDKSTILCGATQLTIDHLLPRGLFLASGLPN
jgi:hypothetical protein